MNFQTFLMEFVRVKSLIAKNGAGRKSVSKFSEKWLLEINYKAGLKYFYKFSPDH